MRLPIVFIILSLTGCSNSQEINLESMEDFYFPTSKLDYKNSFIYQNIGGTEQVFETRQIIERGGRKFLTSVAGKESIKFDSTVALIENPINLIEIYKYEYDSLENFMGITEGSIEIQERFANGTPYGGRRSYVKYERDNIEGEYTTIDNFIADTVFYWNKARTPALYFERTREIEVGHRYIPFIGKSMNFSGYIIYAKGLGLVQYASEIDGKLMEWKLISIE